MSISVAQWYKYPANKWSVSLWKKVWSGWTCLDHQCIETNEGKVTFFIDKTWKIPQTLVLEHWLDQEITQ